MYFKAAPQIIMARFTGEYICKLDAKGRLVLPAKLKAAIPESNGSELMMIQGFEPCLVLYTILEYNKTYSKVAGLDELKKEDRNIQRNFFRRNIDVELDNTGRFIIPKHMMQAVRIEKEVKVVGVGNRMEVWNPEVLEEYILDSEELSDQVQMAVTKQ